MADFTRLEPHVIDEIVRVCEVMLTEFERTQATAARLADVRGFGDFDSAQQLAAGYKRKAIGTSESAHERVEQFIHALKQLRDAFAAGGQAFLDTEAGWARQLAAADPDSGARHGRPSAQ